MGHQEKQLQKTIGFTAAFSTILGMVIGSGIFFKPYAVFKATNGAPGLGMLAWGVASVLTLTGALTAAEIAAMIPKTGGMVTYITEVYGKKLGFIAGWVDSLLYQVAMVAALAVVFGIQAASLLGFDKNQYWPKVLIAIGAILILSFFNSLGSKYSGFIQIVATIAKLIPIITIIGFSFSKGTGNNVFTPFVSEGSHPARAFSLALLATLFSFEGWMGVGMIAGEMKQPKKDLPRALISGIGVAALIYFIMNIAYLQVLPANKLMLTATPAADVASMIFGKNGGKIVSIGILLSVYGALNGYLFTGARSTYTLAKTNHIPFAAPLQKLNSHGVPGNALFYVCIVSSIYCLSGQYDLLTNIATFTAWIFYTLTFLAVVLLRRREPDRVRPYKVPFYPFIPLLAILGGLYVVISTLLTQFNQAVIGLIIMAIGVFVYKLYDKKLKAL